MWVLLMAIIPVALLYRILFTGDIIRASDVVTQYFWSVLDYSITTLPPPLSGKWDPYSNFGVDTTIGGPLHILPWRFLVYIIFPLPASIAWEAVSRLIFAGIGTFIYCRVIGLERFPSFLAGLFFILSSEMVTLINAGHIGKMGTISWLPWVLIVLEKGLLQRSLFYFLLTGGALALQFFEMHWQISFYTCLAVGFYFIFRVGATFIKERDAGTAGRLTLYAVLMVVTFFAASSLSFLPVYSWSKTTERAGGMAYEDGMSWSMPPEELATYLIPGFFGLSRKESGVDPGYIDIYYWGRMVFTQTSDYLGILPLVLAGAALVYRRNWHIGFFLFLSSFTMIVALGKYTPIYRFMYYNLPAFSTFRVPKMILFLFAFGVSVCAGIGAQWLFFDDGKEKERQVGRIIYALLTTVVITLGFTAFAYLNSEGIISTYSADLTRAFRWQLPPDIASRRFDNIIFGSLMFVSILSVTAILLWSVMKKKIDGNWLMVFAVLLFIADVWAVNGRFIVTIPPIDIGKTRVIQFLEKDRSYYKIAPFAGDAAFLYTHYKIPVVSTYVAVSEKNFAEYRDRIDLSNRLLDLMNVKYITLPKSDIGNPPLGGVLMNKYQVVFNEDPNTVVLMSMTAVPRAYPVHQVILERDTELIFNILNHPQFSPWEMAVLEEKPPVRLPPPSISSSASKVQLLSYSNDVINIQAKMAQDGLLVLSEKHYPGWKAYVDGKEEKIYKTNYIMRGVFLTKGTHKVQFVFDPWPYKVGLWISSATFLLLIGAVVLRVRKGTDAPQ